MDPEIDSVNIYGHLSDRSSIIIGAGNFNNISGILTYDPRTNHLQIKSVSETTVSSILQLQLNYEFDESDKLSFSLQLTDTSKYIGVDISDDSKIATACISDQKTIFSLDYSAIDASVKTRSIRPYLLAGSLYSLETMYQDKIYIVSWKIDGFSNGDLIMFLPTQWYESDQHGCTISDGVDTLVHRLNKLRFTGYTTEKWCEDVPSITHCQDGVSCGSCMGPCKNSSNICVPTLDSAPTFTCGSKESDPDMDRISQVTFTESLSATGTEATWLAVGLIFLLVIILTWILTRILE